MSQPRRFHVFYVDNRTLCDQRAMTQAAPAAEGEDLAPCGACVLVAEVLLSEVKGLIAKTKPPEPAPMDAVQLLASGRWGNTKLLDDLARDLREQEYRYPWFEKTIERENADDHSHA